jgi:hypothetical protein
LYVDIALAISCCQNYHDVFQEIICEDVMANQIYLNHEDVNLIMLRFIHYLRINLICIPNIDLLKHFINNKLVTYRRHLRLNPNVKLSVMGIHKWAREFDKWANGDECLSSSITLQFGDRPVGWREDKDFDDGYLDV